MYVCISIIILQVSQLMILYEEAQGGRVTGDLSQLLEAVGAAVQNLVQVRHHFLTTVL